MHPCRNALVVKAVSLKSPKRQAFLRQAGSVHFFFSPVKTQGTSSAGNSEHRALTYT